MLNVNELLHEFEQLSASEKWQLVKSMLKSLEQEQIGESGVSSWHDALRKSYGILADDPIERPPQLPLEEREPME